MHPALLKLLALRLKAWARRFATRGGLLRRIVGGLFFAYILVSWLVAAWVPMLFDRKPKADFAQVLQVGPVLVALLIAMRLAGVLTSRALEFSGAEMDFLFPAPFTRRQLLVYKLGMGSLGGIFFSLVLSSTVTTFAASWISAFLALALAFFFTQLAGVLAALARQRLGKGVYGRITLALGAVILLGAGLAVIPTIRRTGITDALELLRIISERAHEWLPARAVLWPFEVFVRVLVSAPGPELLGWVAVAVVMLALLLGAIFQLDSLYTEAAVAASARSAARLERAKRSGSGLIAQSASIRVPRLPHMGGVGPIAWRQFVCAARAWHSVVVIFAVVAAMFVGARWLSGGEFFGRSSLIAMGVPLYIVFSSLLRFDFRGDIEHIGTLKALPLRPAAVALGQLTTPTLIVASTVVLIGTFAVYGLPAERSGRSLWVLPASLLCTVPLGLMLCSIENIVFLHFPTRVAAGTASDTNALLRHAAMGMLKVLLLLVVGGILGAATAISWGVSESIPVAVGAFWIISCLLGAAGVGLVSLAFQAFDPSRDMPA